MNYLIRLFCVIVLVKFLASDELDELAGKIFNRFSGCAVNYVY